MVPMMSGVTINAKPITEFATESQIESIRRQTILRGNDIIKLTGKSSVLGPSHAVMHMIEQIDTNPKVQLPCSVWDGERAIGRMTQFTARQVSAILSNESTLIEAKMMQDACKSLDKQYKIIVEKYC
jgi:malate/lactate dehydrogenase